MTPLKITEEIQAGNAIFDNGYEAFYTALAKTDSLSEARELANRWGFNASVLGSEWDEALQEARDVFLDS